MIKARCPECLALYPAHEYHKCRAEHSGATKTSKPAVDIDKKALEKAISDGAGTIGTPVVVRMQPGLLARLDKARGGMTRPQKVREILDKALD